MTNEEQIEYLSPFDKYKYCRKCGWYLVLCDQSLCDNCMHQDKKSAKKTHQIVYSIREWEMTLRKKYFPNKQLWRNIRVRNKNVPR